MPKHQQNVVIENVEAKLMMQKTETEKGDHIMLNLSRESKGQILSN